MNSLENSRKNDIDAVDQDILASAFNSNGYVLDFTDATFAQFTIKSVGVSVQNKYGGSKARSLARFTCSEETNKVVKLYQDLIRYFEVKWADEVAEGSERATRILALKQILAKYEAPGSSIKTSPTLLKIDRVYIRNLVERANNDIEQNQFDSALTKTRTLLEEVFCYVIEKKKPDFVKQGDINTLYNHVKNLYGMHQLKEYDKRVNGLLAGLEKILTAIVEMRNAQSDAHGVGSKRINIEAHHARLFVNASQTMAEFVLSVCSKHNKRLGIC